MPNTFASMMASWTPPEHWPAITVIESIIGNRFTVRVKETTTFGPHQAVIPEAEGRAFISSRNEFCIDPDDPLRHGFILR